MNKDLLNQIPAEEQPIASKLNSLVEDMEPSQAFQWELENQLMDRATTQPAQSWFAKVLVPVGWTIVTLGGVLLLNWVFRSLVPAPLPAAGSTPTQEVSFAENVRSGNICASPLALAHGFGVFLTNQNKTGFVTLDEEKTIGELRSFAWSRDGKQLAILGNSMGSGNIYLTDSSGTQLQPLLLNGELGYLMDAAWSRDGKKLVMWSSQNNTVVFLMNADGTNLIEKQLGMQVFSTPQFEPQDKSIIFYGADTDSSGLFAVALGNSQTRAISYLVEDESGYAYSPDGSRLAFMEMDREVGEARLVIEENATRDRTVLGRLPIPKGAGSSIPESANLSWSADGEFLVFDFGRSPADRAIYLAHADGTGMVKVVDSAYAPSISADGKCLSYISDKQVFLVDLISVSTNPTAATPILLADLPPGRGTPNFKQDKLQWSPGTTP